MDAFQGERTVGPCKGNKEYEDNVNTSLSIGYECRIISDADNMKLTHNTIVGTTDTKITELWTEFIKYLFQYILL